MDTLTLNSKGQITIPAHIRKKLNLSNGSKVNLSLDPDHKTFTITPTKSILDGYGMLPKPDRAYTIEEMDEGIAQAVAERNARSK